MTERDILEPDAQTTQTATTPSLAIYEHYQQPGRPRVHLCALCYHLTNAYISFQRGDVFISPFIDVFGFFSRLRGGIELKCEYETHGRYEDRAQKQNKRHVIFLVIFL